MIRGDYTNQYIGNYYSLRESWATNQYKGTTDGFEHCSQVFLFVCVLLMKGSR